MLLFRNSAIKVFARMIHDGREKKRGVDKGLSASGVVVIRRGGFHDR